MPETALDWLKGSAKPEAQASKPPSALDWLRGAEEPKSPVEEPSALDWIRGATPAPAEKPVSSLDWLKGGGPAPAAEPAARQIIPKPMTREQATAIHAPQVTFREPDPSQLIEPPKTKETPGVFDYASGLGIEETLERGERISPLQVLGVAGRQLDSAGRAVRQAAFGVPETENLALDIATDPLVYVGLGVLAKGPKLASKVADAAFKRLTGRVPARGVQVRDLIRARFGEMGVARLESDKFVRDVSVALTKPEREALPFIRQGIEDPEVLKRIGREDLIPLVENPSPKLRDWSEKIGDYLEEGYQYLRQEFDEVGYLEKYVPQIWDVAKAPKGAVSGFTTKNPFMKRRSIPSLEEGIELGLTPKTLDIANIVHIYDQHKIASVANTRFAKSLSALRDNEGLALVQRIDKAPQDWVTVNHPALSRAMMVGKSTKEVSVKDTETILREVVEKIRTIERTTPAGTVEKEVGGAVKKLEKVMSEALTARGMGQPEANAYLNRLKSVYAGAKTVAGEATEKITQSESRRVLDSVTREIGRKYPVDIPILSKVPVKVHPEIAREVETILGEPFSHKAIGAFETVNAFLKKSMLSVSFFHHLALTESAFSSGIGRHAVKLWNPYKIYRAIKLGDYDIFKRMPAAKEGVRAGLEFGALSDYQTSRVHNALRAAERATKEIPVAGQVMKGVRKFNEVWDKGLWDYYHNTLKLYAYEDQVAREMKRFAKRGPVSASNADLIKTSVAQFVNDSFGGQNWDKLVVTPKVRQMLHWVLLAPDWTLSVLRQAAAPVRGVLQRDSVTARRGGAFWARAALYYNLVAQGINYRNTEKYLGEGKFTFENDPGHEMNIFIGHHEEGTKRYVRMGKQFREVIDWMFDPLKVFGSKMSPALREGIRQLAKADPGTGWRTDFAEAEGMEAVGKRLRSIAEAPIPFSFRYDASGQRRQVLFALPTSRGMTPTKTRNEYKKAVRAGDADRVARIYRAALENHLDPEELLKQATSQIKSEFTMDDKRKAFEILRELRRQPSSTAMSERLGLLRQQGVVTPDVEKQLQRILEREAKVAEMKARAGIR